MFKEKKMASSADEQILRASKEIIVKFIETGRVSPTAFPETFRSIYNAVKETVEAEDAGGDADDNRDEKNQ